MDLLKELVIPPSENHIMLVKYMLVISLILFIPYISMVLGASFISTYFNKKGRIENNPSYLRFSKDVIEKLTISRTAELALGAIPAASALFAYAQLLYASKSITIGIMALSVLMFIISFVFIYRYRSSFQIIRLLDSVRGFVSNVPAGIDRAEVEINKLEDSVLKSNALAFNFGKWLLFAAAYLFIGTKALAGNPDRWNGVGNILQVIFSWQTVFDFIQFLSIAGVVTGSAILFYFFYWQGGMKEMEEGYKKFVKNFAGGLTLISAVLFPLTISISYLYLPASAQTQSVFLFLLVILVLALIISVYIYSLVKNSDTEPAALVFGLIIVLLLLNIIKDQQALAGAIEPQLIQAVKASDEMEKEVKSKLVSTTGIDAAQIYNTKCIACHKFDQKVVGPPYQLTVPKYNGDVNKLAEYIYNPQKIDPAFPPMPNQGLKKKEAQAVAKWLIDQVAGKPKP
ncbi:MAG TPA: c-type cytochrome [Ignavibacteria bacterium]|nr:c-type cytochrome [Ignavibacteria bacterium]